MTRRVQLPRSERGAMQTFGDVTYEVVVDGRWVGWVGNGREMRRTTLAARRWWACWRQDGDESARWSTGCDYPTRRQAVAALLAHIETSTTK